jgi:hypothetical protein
MCAGFPVWSLDNAKVYFPIWTHSKEHYLMQQIVFYDFSANELSSFERTFSTVTLKNLTANTLEVIESDLFRPNKVTFDLSAEKIAEKIKIEHKIVITPNEGIGFINLGDDRKFVREKVLNPQFFAGTPIDYYTSLGFHVHYDKDEKVEFIEMMSDFQTIFELYEKNPFTAEVDEIVKILSDKNGTEINLIDAPESYMFLDLSLGIFRNSTPEKMSEYIEQYQKDDPESFKNGMPDWLREDLEKSKHFTSLSVGNKDYFRNEIYLVK